MDEEDTKPTAIDAGTGSVIAWSLGKPSCDHTTGGRLETQSRNDGGMRGSRPRPRVSCTRGGLSGEMGELVTHALGFEALTEAIDVEDHYAPLFKAVRDGNCNVALVQQSAGRISLTLEKPTILVIGDDTDRALGPGGFDRMSIRRFAKRCGGAVLVPGVPLPVLYRTAARMAERGRAHVLLIETRPEQRRAWEAFLKRARPSMGVLVGAAQDGADG